MSRRDQQEAINIAEYLQQVVELGRTHRAQGTETIPANRARGRVLATPLLAREDIPRFPNSAMDGYAIQAADLAAVPATLKIVGEQPAGKTRALEVVPGTAVRIMTGAPLPAGADTVVQSELTEEDGKDVRVLQQVAPGSNVRGAGEDAREGQEILPTGTLMGARQLGAAAAVGADNLEVFRPLKVGIISTGDELVPPGGTLEPGQIYESNSALLAALVEENGMEAYRHQSVDDTPESLAAALDELAETCDAIFLTGGVSVGRFDVVRNLLEGKADAHFHRVALQPGKPQGRAIWNGKPLLAFPGNPVGAFVSFHVFGRPFLRELSGQISTSSPRRQVEANAGWTTPANRTQYVPGILKLASSGKVVFEPVSKRGSGSHLVSTLGRARALAVIPAAVEAVQIGDIIDVEDI